MESTKTPKSKTLITIRIVLCVIVLLIGIKGMQALANLKEPPAEVKYKERPLKVKTLKAEPEDVEVLITGYGEVKSLDTVTIAPEVSGKIVEIHARLEPGEIIPKGELLFKIDSRDYLAGFNEAKATVSQWRNTISRLKKEYEINKARLKTSKRSKELAKAEFDRLRKLYLENKVGTQSGVDAAEKAYNAAVDQADQMAQAVEIYPIRIKENESSLASARSRLATAETNLKRCKVVAPFDGRVKEVSLEAGQYVSPGQNVVTLADDSVLEIHIPLDSRDARKWLRFNEDRHQEKTAWFGGLNQTPCKIRWTEDADGHVWEGRLHRVVKFDQQTRTLTAAVRIEASKALSGNTLPLVEGMFCSVEIPGKSMHNVVRLPRWAVSYKNMVYLNSEGRLKTVPVKVARIRGEETFVEKGLDSGDEVIVTRLVDPLENSLLEIIN
ncbi:MAG: efflux RND transporter periplasmic adaptor subunit [Desulfobacterales bacterium]|nr:efflux RND transporter periplasmic adaptor subunit [Desulfobacterales bacterium]